ncbi:ROK family protein [candidate division KSB1 bacterium]|nr:MAG: hypothetical protein B5M50_01120 [candidate division KSB1 bacterium 4484_219]RKY79663.1 MAG: ROK family protein [candidate division KSB1 bacterium]RKY88569.1 MAG: ROK family protein [candidate division KSB1 bacterium]RKY92097.1 MAG: ROK family protein [candidate division KSB1 bacterium]
MARYAIGVDVGGTKTSAAAISDDGTIVGNILRIPTLAERPRQEVEARLFQVIEKTLRSDSITAEQILGIGVGTPGPLDLDSGTILDPWNLPTLHYYPLKQRLEQQFGLPVFVDNDANCFALGEAYFGQAKNMSVSIGITLGTGLGCGIVIDGKIFQGATGTAAEIWITPYLDGNFEDILSGRGLVKLYQQITGQKKTAPEIEQAAQQGEKKALEVWQQFGYHLGILLAYLINCIDPEVIVIGGSISKAFELFKGKMRETVMQNICPKPRENLKVFCTQLGEKANIFGAARLVFENRR